MKKILTSSIFLLLILSGYSQNEESTTRIFIEESHNTRIDKDWRIIAEFNSGIGEYVKFYPIEVIDLKSGEKRKSLQLDMYVKKPDVHKTAWVGPSEIDEFIEFIELYIIPNLDLKFKDKSSEFIFKAKEMTLKFRVYEKKRRLTIRLNSYDNSEFRNYSFWTETQVDKIPNLLEVLKVIK